MTTVQEIIHSLAVEEDIELFELDLTFIGGGILRFTSTSNNRETVSFNNKTYTPINVEAEGFEFSGQGAIATPILRISNALNLISSLIEEFGDLIGATLRRVRTFRRFLDNELEPDGTAVFGLQVWRIERKTHQNRVYVEWELSSPLDQEGKQLPGRQALRVCTHRYRRYDPEKNAFDYTRVTCPYVGGPSFTANNEPTDPSADRCNKQLSGCRKRFGNTAVLPTRAFPGLAKLR